MANIALKIGDSPRFQDGDVLDVFTRRRIRCCHAEHVCFPRQLARSPSGELVSQHIRKLANGCLSPEDVSRDFYESTHSNRFRRTGVLTAERDNPDGSVTLITGPIFDVAIGRRQAVTVEYPAIKTQRAEWNAAGGRFRSLSRQAPDSLLAVLLVAAQFHNSFSIERQPDRWTVTADGEPLDFTVTSLLAECQDVELYVERRLRSGKKDLFGDPASAIWYGGTIDTSHAKLDRVWQAIESKTPNREASHLHWPAQSDDLKHHLFLPVMDMADAEADTLKAEEWDRTDPERPVLIRKRTHQVRYREISGVSTRLRDIEDPAKAVDLRAELAEIAKSSVRQKPTVPRDAEGKR